MFKKFKKLVLNDFGAVERFQDNVDAAINSLPSIEIIQGRIVKNISLQSSTTTSVEHKLGRAPLGWTVIRKRDDANVWDTQDSNATPSLTLNLTADANVIIDIWVF